MARAFRCVGWARGSRVGQMGADCTPVLTLR